MGRPWKGKSQPNNVGRKKKGNRFPDFNEEELDDSIDKFHKSKDKISLDVDDDNELSDEDIEEPVFDLQGKSSDEDDDEESDDEDLDEDELSGLAAKMAKQQKILRQKTYLMEDEEDEDEEEDEEQKPKEKAAPWGKRKKAYYDADNVDYLIQSSDEETPAEEETEALRLQRLQAESLRPEDFEFSGDDDDDEKSLQEIADKQEAIDNNLVSIRGHRAAIKLADPNMLIEEVKKDVSALSKEEQMNVVMSDAPELEGLLAELRQSLDELHNKIEPTLSKVKKLGLANKGGLTFLETKHMLLMCYCQSILFYLLMKAEGRSVRDHPVIARLVEIRTLLEKLQPVDKKLQKQIDKLMDNPIESSMQLESKEVVNYCVSADDKQTVDKCETQTKGLSMENSKSKRKQHTDQAKIVEDQTKRKCGETNIPDVIHPDFFERLDNIKQAKANSSVESDDDEIVLPTKKHLNKIIISKVKTKKNQVISGDMDLPVREELGERRSKFEMRRLPSRDDDDMDDVEKMDGSEEGEEDDFYKEAKRLKTMKRAMKDNKKTITATLEPVVEEEVGKRHITYDMEKNKGLTPHRKKLTKNPRKKYKLKHQKAVIRRKGQVRDIKKPSGPYSGESTGIRTAISRSVRFHS